jgi:hypothetical protein
MPVILTGMSEETAFPDVIGVIVITAYSLLDL